MHIHHIIPRHMGGTDHPDNLIELSIEKHAQAHKKLYEEHGKIEDKMAWKGLAGMINDEEIIKMRPPTVKVSKLTGAGDVLMASHITKLLERFTNYDAMFFALEETSKFVSEEI